MAASATTLLVLRIFLRRLLTSCIFRKQEFIQTELRPAELAYLLRSGDMGHTMTVMAIDLIQRAVKGKAEASGEIAAYEDKMWAIAKRSVKEWAKKTVLLPSQMNRDPIGFAKRMSRFYVFVATTASKFLQNVISDPRQIRKYFSLAGVLRLVSDFSSAGYQQALEAELKADLTVRGLLVSDSRRIFFSRLYFIIAAFGIAVAYLSVQTLLGNNFLAMATFFISLLGALVLRMSVTLREVIPLYTEVAEILGHLTRKSWRIAVLRTILHLLRFFMFAFLVLIFSTFVAINFIVASSFNAGSIQTLCCIIVLTLGLIPSIDFLVDAFVLTYEQKATSLAEAQIAKYKKRLSHLSPFNSFLQTMQSAAYDQEFSELLAIYGIEMLLVLA
jgi:hypothetical protein